MASSPLLERGLGGPAGTRPPAALRNVVSSCTALHHTRHVRLARSNTSPPAQIAPVDGPGLLPVGLAAACRGSYRLGGGRRLERERACTHASDQRERKPRHPGKPQGRDRHRAGRRLEDLLALSWRRRLSADHRLERIAESGGGRAALARAAPLHPLWP